MVPMRSRNRCLRHIGVRRMLAAIAVGMFSAMHGPAVATDDDPGLALYEGRGATTIAAQASDGRTLGAEQGACVTCHRPSGLGSFEGGVVVPPIAGRFLTEGYDPTTARTFPWAATYRARPGYDWSDLARLLRTGVTPDGMRIGSLMPRYQVDDAQARALYEHLADLSNTMAHGVTDDTVTFATITTPDVPPDQVADLLRVLNTFFDEKNARTRAEPERRAQAVRTEYVMYRRYRTWKLVHWALEGPPDTWREQLEARYAQTPVFAVLSGIGYDDWTPVHAFCERARVPCLLPTLAMPPAREDFYSIYFTRGIEAEARTVAAYRAESHDAVPLVMWSAPTPTGARQAQRVRQALAEQAWLGDGVPLPRTYDVIALGPWTETVQRYARAKVKPRTVYVLDSAQTRPRDNPGNAALLGRTRIVSAALEGPEREARLMRARAWINARHLKGVNERIAVNALLVGTLAVESLLHVDERFSREYCVEKIEHNLENMPPLTTYPRLSIGPHQRFAAKTIAVTRADAPDQILRDWRVP